MILKADAVPYGSQLSEEMKAEVARLVEQAQYEGVQLTGVSSWVGNAIVRVRPRVTSTSRGAGTHSWLVVDDSTFPDGTFERAS